MPTPWIAGSPVAMAHSNNGSSDLDAWMSLFGQVGRALGASVSTDDLYGRLLPLAVAAEPDAGGLLAINYVSGEHMTGFTEGRRRLRRGGHAGRGQQQAGEQAMHRERLGDEGGRGGRREAGGADVIV